jgi:succinate dehydrogenase / fumarate reductase flavoprotein subunit
MIDVIVIGSGGAGLSAALSAKKEGKNVLVISKTYPTHSQTCQAQGGINAVLSSTKDDSVENYFNDTYRASHKLGKKEHIEFFCSNSSDTINWLDSIAVAFSRDENGNISQRKFGGTKAKRTCYSSDYTGLKILHTLYDQCLKNNITFQNESMLLDLVVENNKVKGVIVYNLLTGEIEQIQSKAVILAGGGYAGVYTGFTTNSYATTGDCIAIAYKSGAKISNMEFVQFHPTALENKNILISESARGEGGYLVDEDENRFIDELKPRDEVARAIFTKNLEGKKVYLDLRHLGLEKINETMPQERRLVQEFMKLNMENDLIPINPSSHYSMGGILTKLNTQTSIKNLFACGECSQSGVHGANRLGGNSLLEIVMFGKEAGKEASRIIEEDFEEISDNKLKAIKMKIENLFESDNYIDFYSIKKELGRLMFENVGLFREEKKLKTALSKIEQFQDSIKNIGIKDKNKTYNKNLTDYLELENMLIVSQMIVNSALNRKESRGAHYRVDFKDENESFDKNSILISENGVQNFFFEEIK